MPSLHIVISDRAMDALKAYARANGRIVEDLAEAAVEEAALAAEVPSPPASRTQAQEEATHPQEPGR